jgi:hypothetical protein
MSGDQNAITFFHTVEQIAKMSLRFEGPECRLGVDRINLFKLVDMDVKRDRLVVCLSAQNPLGLRVDFARLV